MLPLITLYASLTDLMYEKSLMFAASCSGGGFFALPTWYKYLEGQGTDTECAPVLNGIDDVWLIVLAVIEILLRLAILVAIAFTLLGGIKFITSRGNPDKIQQARNTTQDALIGLVIAIAATAAVSFIGGSLS